MRALKIFYRVYGGKKRKFGLFKCEYCDKEFESLAKRDDTTILKSCGCMTNELKKNVTHGLTNHRLYRVWASMKNRCHNKKDKGYSNYGDRGITVCNDWRNSFISFYDWSISNGYEEGSSIDRIDNDSGYSPDNCRYTTTLIQNCNRRNFNKYGYFGVTKKGSKYLSYLSIDNKKHHIGSFDTIVEAGLARDVFILINGLQNQLNFKEYKCL